MQKLKWLGLAIVFLWFFVGGVTHFTNKDMFVRIVPPYIPFALAVVYISGVFEVLGALALWLPRWREWAGNGLIVLTICVTPANVYMWMNPQLFPTISETALGVRLLIQVVLIACIWWSTRVGAIVTPTAPPTTQTNTRRLPDTFDL
jgi:uncharacterized membrane protein